MDPSIPGILALLLAQARRCLLSTTLMDAALPGTEYLVDMILEFAFNDMVPVAWLTSHPDGIGGLIVEGTRGPVRPDLALVQMARGRESAADRLAAVAWVCLSTHTDKEESGCHSSSIPRQRREALIERATTPDALLPSPESVGCMTVNPYHVESLVAGRGSLLMNLPIIPQLSTPVGTLALDWFSNSERPWHRLWQGDGARLLPPPTWLPRCLQALPLVAEAVDPGGEGRRSEWGDWTLEPTAPSGHLS